MKENPCRYMSDEELYEKAKRKGRSETINTNMSKALNGKRKAISVDGKRFESYRAAADYLGVTPKTFVQRVRQLNSSSFSQMDFEFTVRKTVTIKKVD